MYLTPQTGAKSIYEIVDFFVDLKINRYHFVDFASKRRHLCRFYLFDVDVFVDFLLYALGFGTLVHAHGQF